jgi:hypothetical protein
MSVEDIPAAAITILLIGIILWNFHFINDKVMGALENNSIIQANNNSMHTIAQERKAINMTDWLIVGAFIGISLALLILAWNIAGNPIFVMFYYILLFILLIPAMIISNMWESYTSFSFWGNTITYYKIGDIILLNLPKELAAIGLIAILIIYLKPLLSAGVYRQ